MTTTRFLLTAANAVLILCLLYSCQRGISMSVIGGQYWSELPPNEYIKHISDFLVENNYTVELAPDTRYNIGTNYSIIVKFANDHLTGEIDIGWLSWSWEEQYSVDYHIESKNDAQSTIKLLKDFFNNKIRIPGGGILGDQDTHQDEHED